MATARAWRRHIRSAYGIRPVSRSQVPELVIKPGVLWATRCARTKPCKKGRPQDLYDSYITRHFYRFVTARKLPFAIVSDKYGLHFGDESLSYYDVHPSSLTAEDKEHLGRTVRRKASARRFTTIVFYNNSPLMSLPYLEILSHAGLSVFFTTRLHHPNK